MKRRRGSAAGSPAPRGAPRIPPSPHAGPSKPWTVVECRPSPSFPAFLATIPPRTPGEIVIVSHNVNGIRAAVDRKNLGAWIAAEAPDVIALQEIKCSPAHLAESSVAEALAGYTVFANCSTAKLGYAGTLLAVRKGSGEALRVCGAGYDLGVEGLDGHGRVTALEFPGFYLVCVYVPNSGRPDKDGVHPALQMRSGAWDPAFRAFLEGLRTGAGVAPGVRSTPLAGAAAAAGAGGGASSSKAVQSKLSFAGGGGGKAKAPAAAAAAAAAAAPVAAPAADAAPPPRLSGAAKPVLVIGDLNVAFNDIDVWDMSKHRNRTSCALDPERDGFARLLETFRDVWRDAHPKARGFTYFKDTRADRETTGWRIDHALAGAPPGGAALQVAVDIRTAWPAGDHVPLVARIKAPVPV